jgi:hypothetical protein
MILKTPLRFLLEIFISFCIIYFYAIEIKNRHFLCFSNNQCVTVWDRYIIPQKYYGLMLPSEYAEININKKNHIYLLKTSNEILMTEPFKNSILNNKIKVIKERHSTSYDSFSLWIEADPIPTFFLAKNNKIIESYPKLLTPTLSLFLSSVMPLMITLLIVGTIRYYAFPLFYSQYKAKMFKITMIWLFKLVIEAIFIMVVIVGLYLLFLMLAG